VTGTRRCGVVVTLSFGVAGTICFDVVVASLTRKLAVDVEEGSLLGEMERTPDGNPVERVKGCEEGISEGGKDKRFVGETVGNSDRRNGRLVAVLSRFEVWIMATGGSVRDIKAGGAEARVAAMNAT
jgi:hypothetical protein